MVIYARTLNTLALYALLFLPIFKYFMPSAMLGFLPVIIVSTIYIVANQRLLISKSVFWFVVLIFSCLSYALLVSIFNFTDFTTVETFRYFFVVFSMFSFGLAARLYGFSVNLFIYISVLTSVFILIGRYYGYFSDTDRITYSQVSYGLFPLAALGISLIFSKRYFVFGLSIIFLIFWFSFFVVGARSIILFVLLAIYLSSLYVSLYIFTAFSALLVIGGLNIYLFFSLNFEGGSLIFTRFERLFFSLSDEPRVELYSKMLDAIFVKPLGYGLGNQEEVSGAHPHSLILEFFLNFGWLLGLVLVFFLLVFVIKTFSISMNRFGLFFANLMILFVMAWMISNDFGSSYFLMAFIAVLLGYNTYLTRENFQVKTTE